MQESLRVYWKPGDKARLARLCDISPQYLSNLIHGHRRAGAELADKLSKQAKAIGIHLTRDDLLYPLESSSPLIKAQE